MKSPIRTTARHRATAGMAVLALMGGALLSGCGESDGRLDAVAGDPASPAATADPTTDPTDLPTTTEPTTPTEPTDPPTTGDRITAAEYSDDWNFRLGDAKLKAVHVRGTDYDDCTDLEVKGSLTSRGCQYGVKVTYKARGGKIMFTNMILEMSSEAKATKFSNDKSLTDGDFNYEKDDVVPAFDKGQWRARSAGKYVVFTVATGAGGVTQKQVKNYLHYANADFTSALLWR